MANCVHAKTMQMSDQHWLSSEVRWEKIEQLGIEKFRQDIAVLLLDCSIKKVRVSQKERIGIECPITCSVEGDLPQVLGWIKSSQPHYLMSTYVLFATPRAP